VLARTENENVTLLHETDATVRNLLYRRPEFYELAYPEPNDETPMMCRRMFARYLSQPPRSILDIGCGTGRDLDSLSKECADCWGVDYLPEMIEYAKVRRSHLHLQVGDMRTLRLGRTFDVVMSMGSALMYAITNVDVASTLDTFAAHSHPGTLLILDINNAASYLGSEPFKQQSELHVDLPDFSARACATYRFDRRRQLLVRRRTWTIDGQGKAEDFCEYRLFLPGELEHLLSERGFRVDGMFDNMQLQETELSGPRLYTAALFQPEDAGA
jgi:SAM-dependent methyltransferase